MSFAMELAHVRAEDAADLLCDDLERIMNRLVRPDAHLVLEQESARWWIVIDQANEDAVMMRAEHELCVRFMRAFCQKNPGATFDAGSIKFPVEHTLTLAAVIPIRMLEQTDEARV